MSIRWESKTDLQTKRRVWRSHLLTCLWWFFLWDPQYMWYIPYQGLTKLNTQVNRSCEDILISSLVIIWTWSYWRKYFFYLLEAFILSQILVLWSSKFLSLLSAALTRLVTSFLDSAILMILYVAQK